MKPKPVCYISGKEIPEERVEALKMLGVPEHLWTCVEYSITKPKKAIYSGEVGTSDLIFCDKVYDDSVRKVFKSNTKDTDEADLDDDIIDFIPDDNSDQVDIVKRSDL